MPVGAPAGSRSQQVLQANESRPSSAVTLVLPTHGVSGRTGHASGEKVDLDSLVRSLRVLIRMRRTRRPERSQMSNPRNVLLAGAVTAALLGGLVVLGVWLEHWVLAATAGAATGGLILLVQVDTWRRTRQLRNFVRDEIRSRPLPPAEPVQLPTELPAQPTHDDLLGTVRLMQAQYTGRLDRLQSAVERALAQHPSAREGEDR